VFGYFRDTQGIDFVPKGEAILISMSIYVMWKLRLTHLDFVLRHRCQGMYISFYAVQRRNFELGENQKNKKNHSAGNEFHFHAHINRIFKIMTQGSIKNRAERIGWEK